MASQVIQQRELIVIGSQSILGSFHESELPGVATRSIEVDIRAVLDTYDEHLADQIDGQLGEWSEFHEANGFYVQGVGASTAVLPTGWQDRLVPVHAGEAVGLCLDPHDLGVAKLIANRDKDRAFVGALVEAGQLHSDLLQARLNAVPDLDARQLEVATNWVSFARRSFGERVDPVGEMFDALGNASDHPQPLPGVPNSATAPPPAPPGDTASQTLGPKL